MPPRARKPAGIQGATATPHLTDQPQRPAFSRPKEAIRREFEKRLDRPEGLYYYSYGKPRHVKSACPDFNKVTPIKENYLERADDSGVDNEDTDSHLLSNEEYNVNESGKV
jgi:hypothetical protein